MSWLDSALMDDVIAVITSPHSMADIEAECGAAVTNGRRRNCFAGATAD
jgi:hypothetical protein